MSPDTEKYCCYKCQFCDYEGIGWLNGGQTCPKCGQEYDYRLAQDSEE